MYAQQGAQGAPGADAGAQPGPEAGASSENKQDDDVDADFKEV